MCSLRNASDEDLLRNTGGTCYIALQLLGGFRTIRFHMNVSDKLSEFPVQDTEIYGFQFE